LVGLCVFLVVETARFVVSEMIASHDHTERHLLSGRQQTVRVELAVLPGRRSIANYPHRPTAELSPQLPELTTTAQGITMTAARGLWNWCRLILEMHLTGQKCCTRKNYAKRDH
jgi:hypothetical protein